MLKKIGSWIGSIKRYFSEIQRDMSDIGNDIEKKISLEKKPLNYKKEKEKDE